MKKILEPSLGGEAESTNDSMNLIFTNPDIKLAKDIADMRIINKTPAAFEKTDINTEIVLAMNALDNGMEDQLIEEINKILAADAKRAHPRVKKYFNETYIKVMVRKLKLRIKKHAAEKLRFTSDEYRAMHSYLENTYMDAITNILDDKYCKCMSDPNKEDCLVVILPYELYKIVGNNELRFKKTMNNMLGTHARDYRITDITVIESPEELVDARKVNYLGVSVYDRFRINGVILVDIESVK